MRWSTSARFGGATATVLRWRGRSSRQPIQAIREYGDEQYHGNDNLRPTGKPLPVLPQCDRAVQDAETSP